MNRIVHRSLLIGLILCVDACQSMQTSGRHESASAAPEILKIDRAQIIDRETKSIEYEKTREPDKLKEILAPDFVACFGTRTLTREDVIRSQETIILKDYAMFNVRLKPISKDVVVIYYILEQDGASDGKKWDPKVAASATYAKRNGVWYSVFYEETVIAD